MEEELGIDRSRRARRQTTFFSSVPLQNTEKKSKRILMKIGDAPLNLKPILRKKSASATSAKKILKKYSKEKQKSVTYSDRCQIQLVTPLPGWKEDVLRMAEDDDQKKSKKSGSMDLFSKIKITPESLERLAITCQEDAPEEAKIRFNARITYEHSVGGTPSSGELQKQKRKNRRTSILSRPSEASCTENDLLTSLQSLHDSNRRQSIAKIKTKSLSSWISSATTDFDSSLEKENAAFGVAAADLPQPSNVVFEPVLSQRKSKRRSFFEKKSEVITEERSDIRKHSSKSRRSLAKVTTDIDCSDTMRKLGKGKITKLNKKTDERQTLNEQSLPTGNIRQKKGSSFENKTRTEKSAKSECNFASSPEILVVTEKPKTARSKRRYSIEGIKAKRVLYNDSGNEDNDNRKRHISAYLDYAPIPKFHILDPTCTIHISEALPEITFLPENPPRILECITFPVSEVSKPLEFIPVNQITDLERNDLLSNLETHEKEWISLFNGFDLCLPWSESFSPKMISQWIGNPTVSKAAEVFLQKWKKRTAREVTLNVSPVKNQRRIKSGSTSDADSDFEDDELIQSNPLILLGPTGSGKTALIHALASELNMNIVEVHPGEKRGAAALKQKLDGTLKNHALRHKKNSIAKFLGVSSDPTTSQNNLIVVEHVDIYFKEDNDFWPTLKSLVEEARVPMIFTCESFPGVELRREPQLDSYELLDIGRCSSTRLAKYIRCCLWTTKNLDASLEDLEIYVKSFNCNLRRVLADLQMQTATPESFKLYLPELTDCRVSPSTCDKETTYHDRQSYLSDKRTQYSSLYSCLQIIPRATPHSILLKAAEALKDRLPECRLALDFLPYLVEMDTVQQKANSRGRRRCLHYFNEVRDDRRIDSDGTLIPLLREYKIIQTNS